MTAFLYYVASNSADNTPSASSLVRIMAASHYTQRLSLLAYSPRCSLWRTFHLWKQNNLLIYNSLSRFPNLCILARILMQFRSWTLHLPRLHLVLSVISSIALDYEEYPIFPMEPFVLNLGFLHPILPKMLLLPIPHQTYLYHQKRIGFPHWLRNNSHQIPTSS